MRKSLVRQALEAYSSGNYALALSIYRELADHIGQDFFSLNIALCQKEIHAIRPNRDNADIPLEHLKIACIMDDFTFSSYAPECLLFPLTPQNAVEELQQFQPDMLFVESAWRGKDSLWDRKICYPGQALTDVLDWCRSNAVPSVFWNKEDPVHFTTFLSTAHLFDFVFTTDIDCITRYKAALGHERVYLLPFACQPRLHNPIERFPRKNAFCFAGAYYVRYPERTRDLEEYIATLPAYRPLEIFDRNFDKEDANYQFTSKFQPFIVGGLTYDEIDRAYKGYCYAINLNSIKNSQSMFARRVYELLASNTLTISNYSRGMRLMFGDLVLASDSGEEIIRELEALKKEDVRKFTLAGLRKVLLEHTYAHRLRYIARKALGYDGASCLPMVTCVALVTSLADAQWILECHQRQSHNEKHLFLVFDEGVERANLDLRCSSEVTTLSLLEARSLSLASFVERGAWLAPLSPRDYYGCNYLLDIITATKYSDAPAIGKAEHYQWTAEGPLCVRIDSAYRAHRQMPYRCCAVSSDALPEAMTLGLLLENTDCVEWDGPCLAVDPFNYCENGREADTLDELRSVVDDQPLDAGKSMEEILRLAESIPPAKHDDSSRLRWKGDRILQLFDKRESEHIRFEKSLDGMAIYSTLAEGVPEYIYSTLDTPVGSLPFSGTIECFLESAPGLKLLYVFVFLDANARQLSHVILEPNKNQAAQIPGDTAFIRFGLRVYGPGGCTIRTLLWGHRNADPGALLHRNSILLLTNNYPEYNDLYCNAFVHSRVKAYKARGVAVDVFRFRSDQMLGYHEFQGVDVTTGGKEALRKLLAAGGYRHVLVHFLSPEMWDVLKNFPDVKVIIWLHGAEIQPWPRRKFNYRSERQRVWARKESELRMEFWGDLLATPPPNLHLVFVSRHFAEEVMEDLGFRFPDTLYSVIHNPIDTDLFAYHPKGPEQRKKILSIHSYLSAKYANDLSVKAIRILAENPFFAELEFRMIGEGPLFDEILDSVKRFSNVICERRFLTQREIAALHGEYGIFLSPTRWDSQGVSRNEAMSSGLVPITNNVAAIHEFMDSTCAMLAPAEDAAALAGAIRKLYEDPELFLTMSRAASARVRQQSGAAEIIARELEMFG